MAVDVVFDGREALDRATLTTYDVVVLDRDLPVVHGDDVCRSLAADGQTAVLMLTAAGRVEDRVDGLGMGADDYLPKPFHVAELVARVRALARRSRRVIPPKLVNGDLELDPAHRLATRAGARLELAPKEFAVLEVLLGAQGAVVSTEELLERAWDAGPLCSRSPTPWSRMRPYSRADRALCSGRGLGVAPSSFARAQPTSSLPTARAACAFLLQKLYCSFARSCCIRIPGAQSLWGWAPTSGSQIFTS
jgi:CheY-like chemotaxis protein